MNQKRTRRIVFAIAVTFFLMTLIPSATYAQEKSALVKRIEAVSRQAKSVDSGKEYGEIIAECDALLQEDLERPSHAKYLKTLLGWALDKRGVTRVDLSEQFLKAGSLEQARLIAKQAMDDFNRSRQNNPNRWQTLMHRGAMLASQDKFEEAIADYDNVLNLDPENTDAFFNRAELKFQIQDFQAALADYATVLQASPNDVQAINGRAHCRLSMGDTENALMDYNHLVEQLPNDGWTLANRADAYVVTNEWSKAIADLEKANTISTNSHFLRRLSWLLATCPEEELCDGPRALDLAQQAIRMEGESAENLDTLAAAYAASGKYDRARDVYSRVTALLETEDPDSKVKQTAYENNERYQEKFER